METTDGLKLNITTESSFEDDDIKNTIVEYGNNFSKLEKYLKDSTQSIEDLGDNKYYPIGHIMWNKVPASGSYIGWVVTREGIQAKKWLPNKNYSIGNLVKPPVDNGGLYECVVDGKSSTTPPTFITSLQQEFPEVSGKNLAQRIQL